MNTESTAGMAPSSASSAGSGAGFKDAVSDALERGRSGVTDSAYAARDSLTDDMAKLRADMASIQDTLKTFVSEASGDAAKTALGVGQAMASQVSSAASDLSEAGAQMASSATEQVKTFASELETMARKNPLGALAATLVVGVVIGMMSRK